MCLCYNDINFSCSGQSRDVEKETAGSNQRENHPTIPKMYYNGGCTLIEPCNDGNLVWCFISKLQYINIYSFLSGPSPHRASPMSSRHQSCGFLKLKGGGKPVLPKFAKTEDQELQKLITLLRSLGVWTRLEHEKCSITGAKNLWFLLSEEDS